MDKTIIINGTNLKALRKSLGLTQGQFGKAVNLTASFISQLENGTKGVSLNNLAKIAEHYNKPLEYFTEDQLSDRNPKGKLIRSIRLNKKIRPDEIAEKSGIDILDYYSIENGTLEPSDTQLKNICEALEIHETVLTENTVNNLDQAFFYLKKTGLKEEALHAIEKFVFRELNNFQK